MPKQSPLDTAVAAIWPAVGSTIGLGIFVNLIMLVPPIYSMQVYDRVLSSRNATTLLLLTFMAIGFLAVYGVLEYARTGILQRAGLKFDDVLAEPLLEAALRSETTRQPGSGAQALKDAETFRDFVSGGLIAVLRDVPWVPVFMLLCFLLHPVLGLVALGGALLIAGLAFIGERTTKVQLEEANRAASDVARFTSAMLRSSGVIRGLGMGEAVFARWRAGQMARFSAQVAAGDRNGGVLATTKFVRMAVQTGLLCAGADRLNLGCREQPASALVELGTDGFQA